MTYLRYFLILTIAILASCRTTHPKNSDDAMVVPKEGSSLVVTEDIEDGIKKHIHDKVLEGDGYFHLKTEDRDLQLQLVRVHTEYLANLGPGEHFACVDLADKSGDVYDVDFFLKGDRGKMTVTKTNLHKLNGRPFYSWSQREDNTWYTVPVEESSTKLMGVIEGKDHFEFTYKVTLPTITSKGKIWIPLAQSDQFQKVDLISLEAPVSHQIIEDKYFGNSIIYMEISSEQSGGIIELTYDVERLEKKPYKDNSNPQDYLSSSVKLPVNDRFSTLADSIIGEKYKESSLMQARALYDYLIDHMRYRKAGEYGTGDAVYACDALSGNCSEFHSFFISLARSAGIPARFAIGAAVPSERNEGGIDGYHCWAEFFAEGKWWPIDVSEANKYTPLSTYYFGRHPANRIEFSRGRDLELSPAPESGPVSFLAYPILEVNGISTPAKTFFGFKRKISKADL